MEEGIGNLSLKKCHFASEQTAFLCLGSFVWFGCRHIWEIVCLILIGRLTVLACYEM